MRELAAAERAQAIERRHAVNVDRIHMVDVVMDAPRHRRELGNHREQKADVMELAGDRAALGLRFWDRAHQIDEERAGLAARAERSAPRGIGRRARDGLARVREHRRFVAHARGVHAERERRIRRELLGAGDRDVRVEEAHAVSEVGLRRPPAATRRRASLEEPLARARHDTRMEIIVLHEALGRGRAIGRVAIAHLRCDELLLFEGEAVASSARVRVQPIANAPQKLFGRTELARFARHQHPEPHELSPRALRSRARFVERRLALTDAKARLHRPPRPVEITKPARAALHVGLEQVDRTTEPRMARRRLFVQALRERRELAFREDPAVRAIE